MTQLTFHPDLLASVSGKTVIVTGAARGIGAATATLYNQHGANVVLTDLVALKDVAQTLITSLKYPESAVFVPASVTDWQALTHAFKEAIRIYGRVDIVVANAGIMETSAVLDVAVDGKGDPVESEEFTRVIDVNLKGTFNTLRLALHYMSKNAPAPDGFRGSVVLVASISGYFGSTGNAAYVASKHGVIGLLRASGQKAASCGVRLNAITPGFTPTRITFGFGDSVEKAGLDANTPETVATAIASVSLDPAMHGTSCLVLGRHLREMELSRNSVMDAWLGSDVTTALSGFGALIKSMGGYRLPKTID